MNIKHLYSRIIVALAMTLIRYTGFAQPLPQPDSTVPITTISWLKVQAVAPDSTLRISHSLHTSLTIEDLNGDGTADTVCFASYRLTPPYDLPSAYALSINSSVVVLDGVECHADSVAVVDFDSSDFRKELVVIGHCTSDHELSDFFCYLSDTLIHIGILDARSFTLPGNGQLHARRRGSILHSWWYPAVYTLDSAHRFSFHEQDLYPMNDEVRLLRSLSLQTSLADTTTALVLKVGDVVTISASDDRRWCLVKTSDGRSGWFAVDNYSEIVGTGHAAFEVFDGLRYLD